MHCSLCPCDQFLLQFLLCFTLCQHQQFNLHPWSSSKFMSARIFLSPNTTGGKSGSCPKWRVKCETGQEEVEIKSNTACLTYSRSLPILLSLFPWIFCVAFTVSVFYVFCTCFFVPVASGTTGSSKFTFDSERLLLGSAPRTEGEREREREREREGHFVQRKRKEGSFSLVLGGRMYTCFPFSIFNWYQSTKNKTSYIA